MATTKKELKKLEREAIKLQTIINLREAEQIERCLACLVIHLPIDHWDDYVDLVAQLPQEHWVEHVDIVAQLPKKHWDEKPIDENPIDEKPIDENPIDENPIGDEEAVRNITFEGLLGYPQKPFQPTDNQSINHQSINQSIN